MKVAEVKRFSQGEDSFIKENYLDMTYKELGSHIHRSWLSIRHRVRRLGLRKRPPQKNKTTLINCKDCKERLAIPIFLTYRRQAKKTRCAYCQKLSEDRYRKKLYRDKPKYWKRYHRLYNIACHDERMAYEDKRREAHREYARDWKKRNLERVRKYNREYHWKNRKKRLAYRRALYWSRPEIEKERGRLWRLKQREKINIAGGRRR